MLKCIYVDSIGDVDVSEFDKLEEYLKRVGRPYKRTDIEASAAAKRHIKWRGKDYIGYGERHIIIVYHDVDGVKTPWFNVVCQWMSWGFNEGLLELMGPSNIMCPKNEYDSVEGWLTAQEIIDRLEAL